MTKVKKTLVTETANTKWKAPIRRKSVRSSDKFEEYKALFERAKMRKNAGLNEGSGPGEGETAAKTKQRESEQLKVADQNKEDLERADVLASSIKEAIKTRQKVLKKVESFVKTKKILSRRLLESLQGYTRDFHHLLDLDKKFSNDYSD
jgi:3-hydroxyacyl-CoA dehydrogenase